MLTQVIGIGTLLVAALGLVGSFRDFSWRSLSRERIAKYLTYSTDLPCARQRQLYEMKVTRAVWYALALGRFKDRRRFGTASVVLAVACAVYCGALFPMLTWQSWPLAGAVWLAFISASINMLHVFHCASVGNINRLLYTDLGGRESLPLLVAPSLGHWIGSWRIESPFARTVSSYDVLLLAAEIQNRDEGQQIPLVHTSESVQRHGHLLKSRYIEKAIDQLSGDGRLGGAVIVPAESVAAAG